VRPGTGPIGATCRGCFHWDHGREYHPKRGKFGGLIKPARCRKFRALTGAAGDKIPDDAAACRHYLEAAIVPPRFEKRW